VQGPAQLSGRATSGAAPSGAGSVPVADVAVVASDVLGRPAGTTRTGADGRWRLDGLAPGRYLVVAVVPAAYRAAEGIDPWLGGPTWTAVLGIVDVASDPIDLVDLRLVPR